MNDVFGYACADAEEIKIDEIVSIYAFWKDFEWEGVVWWVWKKRGKEPISPIRDAILEKIKRGL